ncbi:MAG: RidA family protein [Gammaproteobacteria bacterium]
MLKRVDPHFVTPSSPFSHVVMDDLYVFLAGIVAADIPGGDAVVGDVRAETELIMSTIRKVLQSVELDMDSIVRTDVHLADLDEITEMDRAYGSFFESGDYPARTTTQSDKLFGGCRVEITCTATRR